MKNILYILLINLWFISCDSEKYHNVSLPLYDNKLVINAFVENDNQVQLRISNTKAVTDYKIEYKSYYPDKVFLYANGDLKEELVPVIPNEKMIDYLYFDTINYRSTNTVIDTNSIYQISIEDDEYGVVSSQEIIIPEEPSFKIMDYDTVLIEGQNLLEINCELKSNNKKAYYLLSIYEERFLNEGMEFVHFEIDDSFLGQHDTYYTYPVFSNENFPASIRFKVFVDLYRTNNQPRMFVCLSALTEDGYQYFIDRNKLLTVDPRISEPIKVASNINNGYGIVIGANTAKDSIIHGPPFDPYPVPFDK